MLNENASSSTASLMVTPPSLPKGGGTLSGMGEALGQAGPDGMASAARQSKRDTLTTNIGSRL